MPDAEGHDGPKIMGIAGLGLEVYIYVLVARLPRVQVLRDCGKLREGRPVILSHLAVRLHRRNEPGVV